MINTSRTLSNVELYADEAAARAALRIPREGRLQTLPALPDWALAPEVIEVEGVTRVRPDDVALRVVVDVDMRPGLRYRDLVRHYGRHRLVLDFTGIGPFGHPFHDDIFAILSELRRVGGRLGICGAGKWYVERLKMYPKDICVVPCQSVPARLLFGKLATGIAVVCFVLARFIAVARPNDGFFTPSVCLFIGAIMAVSAITRHRPYRQGA